MTTLYLTETGTSVRYENHQLVITRHQNVHRFRFGELDLVLVLPGVHLSSQAIAQLLDRGVETIFLKSSGQFRGRLQGQFSTNPQIRLAQYQVSDSYFGLALAQNFIRGKIQNQRVLLQRLNRKHHGQLTPLAEAVDTIAAQLLQLRHIQSPSREQLMGFEGICSRYYFQSLRLVFSDGWGFQKRDRQPPPDPINALLSWGYGVLLSRVFAATVQAGLDPYLGFFHTVQPYRPNLVLDLMEEFRPILVDRLVLQIVNNNLLSPEDFVPSDTGQGIWLGPLAKKVLLHAIEKDLQTPLFYGPQNRKLKLNQIMLEQCRAIARCLLHRSLDYEPYTIR
ncbi:CRISPR-associated endonuclease Cas1 [Picosynechococcus sp. NKBG15041c]|uniref:CRISPR-associated endonuclease Cas1 n=1 Tax=Picosynechococcus sp. NKBG15041c TaxID=1407650 RepID=UPI00040439CD|nr:CRISPR-associated endonuclease Cas1 [Picosynechococcus sp. NKBG15041c]